jgi:hypothetical protein
MDYLQSEGRYMNHSVVEMGYDRRIFRIPMTLFVRLPSILSLFDQILKMRLLFLR